MNGVLFEHVDNRDTVAGLLDQDRAEVVEGLSRLEVHAVLDFLEEVGKLKVVDVGVKVEPVEILRVEGLGRLEVSLSVDGIVEDYLEVSLDGLHHEGHVGS